ncbi:MAG: ABC-F family ATP-binding cassette domain-containing protein [Peptococcaceae bacterium]
MSILSIENLVKSYGEKKLFENISFTIAERQRIGLIGVNGAGKTTLLKIIAGLESGEKGQVTHANQFHVEYLPQHPVLAEELTVLEQIYYGDSSLMKVLRNFERAVKELENAPEDAGKQRKLSLLQQEMDALDAWDAGTMAKTVLNRLGIKDYFRPVKDLSGGQKKRVAIARALIQPADLLLLDEPTNHLDNEMIEWLEEFLANYKGALFVVTHDRYFLNRVTNRILELDQGRIYSYEGNYEVFLEGKALREEQERSGEKKRENLLRKELAWLRRGARARTTKQKARIERIAEIKNQEKDIEKEKLDIALMASRLGKKVFELNNLTKSYGDKLLIKDFSYLIVPGERLGIIGPNGTGKTTLLNILAGCVRPDSGVVDKGQTVKIGYYTQDYVDMNPDLRVIEYLREGAEIVKTRDGHLITAQQMLEKFLFRRDMQWTYIRKLSGGERRRLYLLRILIEEPNVLFLDEPTNDLDIETLTILEDYLDGYPGVVITVSHDRYFLDKVVDKLLVFTGGGKVEPFIGSYLEYLEAGKEKKDTGKIKEDKSLKTPSSRKDRPRKLSFKEQRDWDEIEERISVLEDKNKELKEGISHAACDYELLQKLYAEQKQVEAELEQVMERWIELSLIIEEYEKSK